MAGQAQVATELRKVEGDDLGAEIDRLEPKIRRQFRFMVERIGSEHDLGRLAELLAVGRVEEAFQILDRHAVLLGQGAIDGYLAGGRTTAGFLSSQLKTSVVFDGVNERAVREIKNNNLGMIQQFRDEQRLATRQAMTRGISEGLNPRAQARAFRDSVGLTRYQEGIISNYRRELSVVHDRDMATTFARELRDRRSDWTIRNARRDNAPLSQKQIDKMVTRYRERWIKYRSEAIARTEALRSAHQGADEMYRQAIDAGELDPAAIIRKWDTRMDGRQRGWHGFMEGQTRTWGETFRSGQGNELRHPGDPNAPASETIHCRCVIVTRLDPAKL